MDLGRHIGSLDVKFVFLTPSTGTSRRERLRMRMLFKPRGGETQRADTSAKGKATHKLSGSTLGELAFAQMRGREGGWKRWRREKVGDGVRWGVL